VSNKKFRLLGLDPVTLDERLFEEVTTIAQKYKGRAILDKVDNQKKKTHDIYTHTHKHARSHTAGQVLASQKLHIFQYI
jgi:hypothetical protein